MLTESFKKKIFIFIFFIIFIFSFFQFKKFFIEEDVVIKSFENSHFLETKKDSFLFEGEAEKSKKLYINGKEIFLNEQYQFSEKVFLAEFENTFDIKSISKTGVVFNKKVSIFYTKR